MAVATVATVAAVAAVVAAAAVVVLVADGARPACILQPGLLQHQHQVC